METEKRKYGAIITEVGLQKITLAVNAGKKVNLTQFAVGDGEGEYYQPTPDMTELKGQKWRGSICNKSINENMPNVIDISTIIPASVGGWTIREMAVFDNEGNMIAICNTPDTEKFLVTSGAAGEIEAIIHIEVSDTEAVTCTIDPNIVSASKKELEDEISAREAADEALQAELAKKADIEYVDVASTVCVGGWTIEPLVENVTAKLSVRIDPMFEADYWWLLASGEQIGEKTGMGTGLVTAPAVLGGDDLQVVFERDGAAILTARLERDGDADSSGYLWVSVHSEEFASATSERLLELFAAKANLTYCTCGTSASTSAKVATVTAGAFELKTGVPVDVKFTYANTASAPTLNVEGTGAKTIKKYGTTAPNANMWQAGAIVRFIYDGTYWVMQNGTTATATYYGVTKLNSSVNSTSTTEAATPSAVKQAYDKANTAIPGAQKAAANGVASLDAEGKIPSGQLPDIAGKRTCRFVVGTSTAGWTEADVDYLCDGTADDVEINAAIQALPSTGGEIVILDGEYVLSKPINFNKNNISMLGSGLKLTKFKRMYEDGYTAYSPGVSGILIISSSYNTIKNIAFDGNQELYTCEANKLIQLKDKASNNKISHCFFTNSPYGIHGYFGGLCYNEIDNNIFNTVLYGIYISRLGSSGGTEYNCEYNRVCNNVLISNADTRNGQAISVVGNNTIIRENCCTSYDYGIMSQGNSGNIGYNRIDGNFINNCGTGILASSGNYNCIMNNFCYSGGTGISSSGSYVTIKNNRCFDNTSDGISLISSYESCNISSNHCVENGAYGIHISSVVRCNINNNICISNKSGIYALGVTHALITNNRCFNCNERGIEFHNSSHSNVSNNSCVDNSYGIYISSVKKSIISKNTCIRGAGLSTDYTAGQYTIYLLANKSEGNLILHNNISGKNYADNSTGEGNTFEGNIYN